MNLWAYLRRHKAADNTPYKVGGMVSLFAFLILAVFSLSAFDSLLLRSDSLAAVISSVLVDLANGDRNTDSLGGLTISPVLEAAAQAKADDMATKEYFAHISPDGKNSWYWFKEAGYSFSYAGENLAVDFSDSVDVEKAWMNSPSHRANILNGNFTEIGIATAKGFYQGRSTTFVVQMFGTPASAANSVRTITSPTEPTAPAVAVSIPTTASSITVAPTAPTTVLGTEAVPVQVSVSNGAHWWEHLAASPKTGMRYAYYLLAGLIILLLAYVTELEFKRHHLRHVAASAFLLVLMGALFTLANIVFFSQPVLAAGGL